MRDLAEINLQYYPSACSPPYVAPPSAEVVQEFEEHFQVKLPPDYLSFLSLANGGNPAVSTFDYTTSNGEFVQSPDQVGELFSLTADRQDEDKWFEGGVWEFTKFLREVFEENGWNPNVVCIGRNGADNFIYLDTATTPSPIYILYREDDNATPKIAESFKGFIDGLHPWPEE